MQKYMTRKIQKLASTTGSVSAKNHVPIPAADGWFIYIQKKSANLPGYITQHAGMGFYI